MSATSASAQAIMNMAKRAGIGASVGRVFTFDDDVDVSTAFGVNAGLAPAPGFGPTLGFGWYQGDLTFSGLSGEAEVGRLRVRPLMAGVGLYVGHWQTRHGRLDQRGHQLQLDPAERSVPHVLRPRH
jgi:hypothetical protein